MEGKMKEKDKKPTKDREKNGKKRFKSMLKATVVWALVSGVVLCALHVLLQDDCKLSQRQQKSKELKTTIQQEQVIEK